MSTDRRAGVIGNAAIKVPCRVCATANLTLDGEQTIDSVTAVTGDRVLVTAQTSSIDNGIYVCDTGAWTRATDFDAIYDVVFGTLIKVNSGTSNSGFWYVSTTTANMTPGTDAINFGMASAALAVVSAFMQTMLDDATAAAAMTTLGITANGQSLITAANYAAMKALLDLEIGTDVQAYDATLAAIAALTLTQGGLLTMTGADAPAILAKGTALQLLRMNSGATAPEWATYSPITIGTAVATTSGTTVNSGAIPSTAKRVIVTFDQVSTDAAGTTVILQLSTSSTFKTSGYVGSAGSTSFTAGFGVGDNSAAADTRTGCIILELMDAATNKWVAHGAIGGGAAGATTGLAVGGVVSLAGALDMVRVATVAGTAAFDNGSLNVSYE